MWFRSFSERLTWILLTLFASYVLAALQNVTVDDAVTIGAVVPRYLPSDSKWETANCSGCHVKPDPKQAYNGTWHAAGFSSNHSYTQTFEFSYAGSSVYIFFIIANTVQRANTFTGVNFMLDGALVGSYTHVPTKSRDFEYNVPVYANDSVPFGQHSMVVQPVTNLGNALILFDYLIYTTDTNSASPSTSTGASLPAGTSTIVTPSPTSSGTQGTYSRSHIGAIAGGTVGGVIVIALVAALLLYYRRRKRRDDVDQERDHTVDPFMISHEVALASLGGTTSSAHPTGSSVTNPLTSRNKMFASGVTPASSVSPTSPARLSSSGVSSSDDPALHEQVGMLMNEVARLRSMQEANGDAMQLSSEPPPRYA